MVSRGIVVKKEYVSIEAPEEDDLVYIDSRTRATKKYMVAQMVKQEAAQKKNYTTYAKYKVRVPLIHGAEGDASAISDADLPLCTFCPLPGTQITELNEGDTVYVAIVDFKFDELVILGCVPKTQYKSESGAALERVQYLEMDKNAPASFSEDITIGQGDSPITWNNLVSLQGFENKLTEYTWPTSQGGTGVSLGSGEDEDAKRQVRDNFGIFSTIVLSQTEFDELTEYQKNTIYYVYEDDQDTVKQGASGDARTKNVNEVR